MLIFIWKFLWKHEGEQGIVRELTQDSRPPLGRLRARSGIELEFKVPNIPSEMPRSWSRIQEFIEDPVVSRNTSSSCKFGPIS